MAPSKQKGLQRISIQDTEQPPVLINPPQADLWFTWLPSGEPWPRALHSRPCQHLEEPLAALPHQDGFPWEQIQAASPAQLQRCMGAEKLGGSCSALESKRWSVLSLEVNFSPPSLVLASFFFYFFFSWICYSVGKSGLRGCIPHMALALALFSFHSQT